MSKSQNPYPKEFNLSYRVSSNGREYYIPCFARNNNGWYTIFSQAEFRCPGSHVSPGRALVRSGLRYWHIMQLVERGWIRIESYDMEEDSDLTMDETLISIL